MNNSDRVLRTDPTNDERDIVATAMKAIEDYCISIDMPMGVFMSATQAFATQNLSKMDVLTRSKAVSQMLRVAENVYKKRVTLDPTFEPLRYTEDRCNANSGSDRI